MLLAADHQFHKPKLLSNAGKRRALYRQNACRLVVMKEEPVARNRCLLYLCLVKTWSSRSVARWSRTGVGDLVPDSSGDPWSPLELVRQHVKWNAAMVGGHECEQFRFRVEWHA